MASKIFVFIEQNAGEIKKVGLELLSEGRKVVNAAGGELCAVLLGVMVVLCMPYMFPEEAPETQVQAKPTVVLDEEDPEALQHPQESEILEPTVSETEPENPTIPRIKTLTTNLISSTTGTIICCCRI